MQIFAYFQIFLDFLCISVYFEELTLALRYRYPSKSHIPIEVFFTTPCIYTDRPSTLSCSFNMKRSKI